MNSTSTALVFTLGAVVYGALGGLAVNLWQRRTRRPRPANVYANPDAWLSFWLPLLVFTEAWALVGAAGASYLLTVTAPVFKGTEGAMLKLGLVIGLAGLALLLAAYDAVFVMRVRQVARQQAGAHSDDAAPLP